MTFTKGTRNRPSYDDIVAMVRTMPTKEQLLLAEELRREGLKAKWDEILAAFQPNSVSEREIVRASKAVRRRLSKKRYGSATDRR